MFPTLTADTNGLMKSCGGSERRSGGWKYDFFSCCTALALKVYFEPNNFYPMATLVVHAPHFPAFKKKKPDFKMATAIKIFKLEKEKFIKISKEEFTQ
jgi:hypothetical protein